MASRSRKNAQAIMAAADSKLQRLRNMAPYLVDVSLREAAVGSSVGQTLEAKMALLPRLRAFGLDSIVLGALDYAFAHELQVDDDFMRHLHASGADMNGCFALTSMSRCNVNDVFVPDPSQLKLRDYGVPNTLHEIYLSPQGMAGRYDLKALLRHLPASIQWLHENVRGDHGGRPRILVNIVDGCDAFATCLDSTCEMLELLANQPIEGISIEDGRGTYLPFQMAAYVSIAREFLPPPLKLLVHVHSGAGVENASVVDALLHGADGVWGGLGKQAAINGHASLGELLTILARVENRNIDRYQLCQLKTLATDTTQPLPDRASSEAYVLGESAYRLPLSIFRQVQGRFMDLAPEATGGQYNYWICPVVSDLSVISGRLAEVTGIPSTSFGTDVLQLMVIIMRRSLRMGQLIDYNTPERLLGLYAAALKECDPSAERQIQHDPVDLQQLSLCDVG